MKKTKYFWFSADQHPSGKDLLLKYTYVHVLAIFNPRHRRERVTVVGSVCLSVCVSVCPGKISFYIRLCQSFVVPTVYIIWQMLDFKRVDFAKSAWVERYEDTEIWRIGPNQRQHKYWRI